MSLSGAWYGKIQEENSEYNRILKKKGKKAADEYSKKCFNKSMKGLGYSTSGAAVGFAVGLCVPIIGPVIGGTIGQFIGKMASIEDD
ncbi:MAG: hypothetical protein AAF502_19155 [Bacteroidota bacterium]